MASPLGELRLVPIRSSEPSISALNKVQAVHTRYDQATTQGTGYIATNGFCTTTRPTKEVHCSSSSSSPTRTFHDGGLPGPAPMAVPPKVTRPQPATVTSTLAALFDDMASSPRHAAYESVST
eukprot:5109912-Pleurochrysis_carterae.AAC.1